MGPEDQRHTGLGDHGGALASLVSRVLAGRGARAAILGGALGLFIGAKLLGFSFWTRRTDWEPDAGDCVACARCFRSCPQELIRLGITPPELAQTPNLSLTPPK